jgi:archaellum component FlaC
MREYGKRFSDDVALNRNELDLEAELNPSLMQHYSDLLSEARAERDRLDGKLKQVMAECELTIRRGNPKDYGLEKYTEAVITSLVEIDPEVQATKKELLDAKEDLYTYEGAVDALHDKSAMIKVLSSLWIGGYYAANGEKAGD